jgi:hypothetical protein
VATGGKIADTCLAVALGETEGFQIDTVIISGPEDLSDKEN